LNSTAVDEKLTMDLTSADRERLQDSQRKLRSVANTLRDVDHKKIANLDDIEECLEDADQSLEGTLRSDRQ
jgi:hypothetical protein